MQLKIDARQEATQEAKVLNQSVETRFRIRQGYTRNYYKLLLKVALLGCILGALLLVVDLSIGYSVWLGGLIYLIPTAWFAMKFHHLHRYTSADKALSKIISGEFVKIALTILLFTAVMKWISPLNYAALFSSYCLMHLLTWVMLLNMNTELSKSYY